MTGTTMVVLLAPLAAFGCYGSSTDAGTPIAIDPGVIYTQMCMRCHGPDGKGDPELKKTLPVRDFTDAAFRIRRSEEVEQVIMAGKNQMPPFGQALSMPKIQAMAGYVRRLGRK
jgi:mono/diheme cytochrome c family protein